MEYNFKEQQLNDIISRGFYKLANSDLAIEWTNTLIERGYKFYVITDIGNNGVEDVIFNKENALKVKSFLVEDMQFLTNILSNIDRAIDAVNEIIEFE